MHFTILLIYYIIVGVPVFLVFNSLLEESRLRYQVFFSLLFGFIFYGLFQLSIGHIGLRITGLSDIIYKVVFAVLSYSILISKDYRKDFTQLLRLPKIELKKINLFFGLALGCVVAYALLIVNTRFFLPWDVFHYWLLDPRIIFETGYLRSDISLIDIHASYGSFLSVHISDLYELRNEVADKHAAYFTVLHTFFAIGLLSQIISKKDILVKIISWSVLLIVLSTLSSDHWFYSNYTEVHCAFYVLLFNYLLVINPKNEKAKISRILLMLLSLYILVNIKPYWPFAIFFFFTWILYDRFILKLNYRSLIQSKNTYGILSLVFFLIVVVTDKLYHSGLDAIESMKLQNEVRGISGTISELFNILGKLIPNSISEVQHTYSEFDQRIDRTYPKYSLLYITFFISLIIPIKEKKNMILVFNLFALAMIYLLFVTFIFPVKGNDSFYRYMTLFYFLVPLVYSKADFNGSELKMKILAYAIGFLSICHFFIGTIDYANFKAKAHGGSFSDSTIFKAYENVAERTKPYIGDKNIAVIDASKNKISIRKKSVLMTRYNMIDNVVGGIDFQARKIEDLISFIKYYEVEYLLIQNPNMPEVKQLFGIKENAQNSFYLVEIRNLERNNFRAIKIQ